MIRLTPPVARLVIKDIIHGDGAKEEVSLLKGKVELLETKTLKLDSIILYKGKEVETFGELVRIAEKETEFQRKLTEDLRKDLRKAKINSFIYKATTGLGVVAIAAIVLQ